MTETQQRSGATILRTTSATYTLSGKVATATDANGNTTSYSYDLLDRRTRVTDAVGRIATVAYDALSRPLRAYNTAIQSAPLMQQAWTADGLRASLTDANNNTTAFTYDGFDRLSITTYPLGSTESLTYDADSNVTQRCTRDGKPIAFTYDTLNRLTAKTQPGTAATCAGTPAGTVTTYAYDVAGRLTGVSDTSATIPSIATPGSTLTYAATTAYDALNRPTGITFGDVPAATTPGTPVNVAFTHSYNAVNQRTGQSVTDNAWIEYPSVAGTTCYTANALNQYTQLRATTAATCTGGTTTTPTYDANGNLLTDGTNTYTYAAENRLVSATNSGSSATYTFDARGRRQTKTVTSGGTTTTTVYVTGADNRELLEYDGATGAIQRWYAYGTGPNDVVAEMNVPAGTRSTPIPDIQGSIIGSLSNAGVLTVFAYRPFGSSAAPPATFGYTGQRYDAETGSNYYRARQYSTVLGRFMQADPIGYADGTHLYAYVGNDPLNLVDPSGEIGNAIFGAALGFVFDVGVQYATQNGRVNWRQAAVAGVAGGLTSGASVFIGSTVASVGGRAAANAATYAVVNVVQTGVVNEIRDDRAPNSIGNAFLWGAIGGAVGSRVAESVVAARNAANWAGTSLAAKLEATALAYTNPKEAAAAARAGFGAAFGSAANKIAGGVSDTPFNLHDMLFPPLYGQEASAYRGGK